MITICQIGPYRIMRTSGGGYLVIRPDRPAEFFLEIRDAWQFARFLVDDAEATRLYVSHTEETARCDPPISSTNSREPSLSPKAK